jgi:heme/copper-type cytochrome/quinol oxidase subunit 3
MLTNETDRINKNGNSCSSDMRPMPPTSRVKTRILMLHTILLLISSTFISQTQISSYYGSGGRIKTWY